jgi:hypothetical protein
VVLILFIKNPGLTGKISFFTDPEGANVYIRDYSDLDSEWKYLGKTPIDTMEFPSFSFYRVRIEMPGYENVNAVATTPIAPGTHTLSRTLFKEGTIPEEMVYVEFSRA